MKKTLAYISLCLFCSSSFAAVAPSPVSPGYVPGNSSLLDEVVEATYLRNNLNTIADNSIGRQLVAPTELSSFPLLSGLQAGAVLALPSIAYYERTGKDPVYAAYEAVASGMDAIFVPAYQAFKANFVSPESYPASAGQYVGVEGSVGGSIADLTEFAKSHPDTYPEFNSLLSSHQSVGDLGIGSGSVGQIFEGADGNTWTITGAWSGPYTNGSAADMVLLGSSAGYDFYAYRLNTIKRCPGGAAPAGCYPLHMAIASITTLDPNVTPIPGGIDYSGLKNDLQSPSPAITEEIKDAIQNLPSEQKITSSDPSPTEAPAQNPSPITSNQIQNFYTANTTNVYNEYLNTVNNGGDAAVGQAAAETAKAQEEEAKKESEETFSPIGDSHFTPAYAPGPFDIPTRFTSFISTVKTSGLFSFSNNFFSSLPSGGSPFYTIYGGNTFGTHTIDLNDSMGGGLAVLKAVLLACFGFLSIRAVIMKR